MSLLLTDLGCVSSYRRWQALRGSEKGCTVSHRRGPRVSTRPYRINTPATATKRSNERTLEAPGCEQQAKCSEWLTPPRSHWSPGSRVNTFISDFMAGHSLMPDKGTTGRQSDTFLGIRTFRLLVPLEEVHFFLERNLLCQQKKRIHFSLINYTSLR